MNGVRVLVSRINGLLALGAAWQGWPLTILLLTTCGVALSKTDWLLTILSVQASIGAAVMDIRQRQQAVEEAARREAEAKGEALLNETVEDVEAIAIEIKAMADTLIDMAEAAERRDRLNAKSQKMILTALESRGDLYDFLAKGGVLLHDRSGKTTRPARRPGKAHGRANRARS